MEPAVTAALKTYGWLATFVIIPLVKYLFRREKESMQTAINNLSETVKHIDSKQDELVERVVKVESTSITRRELEQILDKKNDDLKDYIKTLFGK